MLTDCPPQDLLRRYIIGDYDDCEGDQIEQHLETCTACEETLAAFDESGDTLVRHLPLAVHESSSSRPLWLDRLRNAPPVDRLPEDVGEPSSGATAIAGLESYELSGVLGKGGMGVVYLARHCQLDRTVAIKVVHPRLTSASLARDRFEREIRILGGLQHPGIVMATDAGKVGDAAYLVMEYVDGIDLARLVRLAGPLSISDACAITLQIASALDAAHAAGAVHRDVKPSNVMLDRTGRTKLLDFGLAQFSPAMSVTSETSVGWMIGTLDYMSPEQSEGKRTTELSDLYSLGATLFYLLTGRPPHRAGDEVSLLEQLRSIAHQTAPRLDSLRGDITTELADFVEQLLSPDPQHRPQSAEQLETHLRSFVRASEEISDELFETLSRELSASAESEADSGAVVASLHELLGADQATSLMSSVLSRQQPDVQAGGTRRRAGWAFAIASGALAAVIAGIVFYVKTSSGTLRIESDVADVRIELVNENQAVEQLEITGGSQETTLRAGRYRIRLASGYDKLKLEPETIVVSSREDQVAKITQIADEPELQPNEGGETNVVQSEARTEEPPAQQDPTRVNGKTMDEWIAVFAETTDPVSKLNAARDAVMAARLVNHRDLMMPIRLGGTLVESGWGDDSPHLVMDRLTNNADPLSDVFAPKNWPADAIVRDAWRQYLEATSYYLGKFDQGDVQVFIAHAINEGADDEAAFTMAYLADPGRRSPQELTVSRAILSGIKPDSERSELATLLLAECLHNNIGSDLQPAYMLIAEQLDRQIETELHRKMVAAWLRHARDVLDDSQNAAPLMLRMIEDDPTTASHYFNFDWMRDSRPYYSQYQRQRAETTAWFLRYWPEAVNAYWGTKSFDEVTEVDRVLFQTLQFYAQTEAHQFDQSVADQTNKLLGRWLENYYGEQDADPTDKPWRELLPGRPDEILATIINLGGEIPEVVSTGLPRPQSARQSLVEFKSWISSPTNSGDESFVKRFAGLIQVAPVRVVRSVLESESRPNGLDHQRALMIAADGSPIVSGPPLDPLLLLAISHQMLQVSESEGESGSDSKVGSKSDVARNGFQELVFGNSPKVMAQHLKDVLDQSSRMLHRVAEQMADIAMISDDELSSKIRSFHNTINQTVIRRQSNPGGGGFF